MSTRPPEVVSVGPAPPWRGGIARYHDALAAALQAEGIRVRVLNFKKLYPRILFPGTTPLDVGPGRLPDRGERLLAPLDPLSWVRGRRFVRDAEADLLLFQWWSPFFAPAYLALARGAPEPVRLGAVVHNVEPHEAMPGGRWLTRRFFRRMDFFIAGGSGQAVRIRRLCPGARVEVVTHPLYEPPALPMPARERAREELGLPADGVLFLFFGLVRPYKGLDVLIEALGMLPPGLAWHCLVSGEFYEERGPYEERIRRLDLSERVRLEDRYIPDAEVGTRFAACDAVVLPYREATQSGAAAWALAHGRPVLSTLTGALPDVIREERTGWLVPPGDATALAAVLERLAREPERARLPGLDDPDIPGWEELARAVLRGVGA